MGLRVRSGYLLIMNLNGAYKVCRDFRTFSWEVTQQVMARRLAEMTVFDHDGSLLEENGLWTPNVMARWSHMLTQAKKSRHSGLRDPEVDMETTITVYPLSTAETLVYLQTEVVEVREAWDKVLGVSQYNYDSISGPDDDEESQEAYYQRGERWRKVLDEGPGFVFKCLGDSYPTPMRNLVLESIPSWEKRLHKAGTVLLAQKWTRENPKGSFGELMSWITSEEGTLARMDRDIMAELEGKLPNPFPVDVLYPPEKA